MPELLRESGVHTHLCTDHYHYIQDGGATYHGRYSTYEIFRGQECDRWIGDCAPVETLSPHLLCGAHLPESYRAGRMAYGAQNDANRTMQRTKADYPQTMTFDAGLAFIRRNAAQDNWFLQIEAFDPHEPFDAPGEFFDPDRIGPRTGRRMRRCMKRKRKSPTCARIISRCCDTVTRTSGACSMRWMRTTCGATRC